MTVLHAAGAVSSTRSRSQLSLSRSQLSCISSFHARPPSGFPLYGRRNAVAGPVGRTAPSRTAGSTPWLAVWPASAATVRPVAATPASRQDPPLPEGSPGGGQAPVVVHAQTLGYYQLPLGPPKTRLSGRENPAPKWR